MANELRHKDTVTGTTLQRTDWEDVDNHRFDSQATGDMLIATSATQLSRLGITNDRILVSSGGLFSWSNTIPAVTLGGAITGGGQNISNCGIIWGVRIGAGISPVEQLQINTAVGRNWGIVDDTGRPQFEAINDDRTAYVDGAIRAANLYLNPGGTSVILGCTLDCAGQFVSWTTSLDSTAVADTVSISGYEIGAGHRALAISSEEAVVVAAAGASDAYVPIRYNGTTYKLLLHS